MSCCGVTIEAHRNADLRRTYTPRRNYSFSTFTALMEIRDGATVLFSVSMSASPNGSVFSIVDDSLVLTIEKPDLIALALSAEQRVLSYDIVLSNGGFEDWFLGGDFVLLGINDTSCENDTDVAVEIGGQNVDVTISGGNIGAGASVLLADLNQAVEDAEASADAAAASLAAVPGLAASAGATAGSTAGALSGASAGTTAGTAAANAVVATKLNTDGSNPTNRDTVKSNLDIISFKIGPTAITGSRFGANWMLQLGADDGSFQGGQWTGQTNAGTIVSKSFTTANTSVTTEVPLPGFLSTVFVDGLGYNGDGVAVMGIATAKQTGDTVFGANFIAAGATGTTNNKLVGLELDVQFPPGSTAGAGSSGLYINTFGATDTGDAIQINAHNGTWANGIKVGGINPTIGAGLSAVVGQTLGSLVNTRSGSYGGVAIELGDTESRGIRIQGPVGDNSDAAQIFNSGGFLIIRGGNQPIVFQRHDTTNTLLIESGGSLDLTAASTVYKAQGTQVVSSRKTGWTADTGTAKRTANATYSGTAEAAYTQATIQTLMNAVRDLSQTMKALKDDLISHGLIGS